jgi:hypothetical protein
MTLLFVPRGGRTALMFAAYWGRDFIVGLLLEHRADVTATVPEFQKQNNSTSLIIACVNGHTSCAHQLMSCHRMTPQEMAYAVGYIGINAIFELGLKDVALQLEQQCERSEAEHAAAIELHRTAGSVVLNRHRGGGYVTSDYTLQFQCFNTFVADVRLFGGCFYFEIHIIDTDGHASMQFGFCTEGFESRQKDLNEGVGDDLCSWAVDGSRMRKWHKNSDAYASKWAAGDVIGFALDMRSADAAEISVSINGSFEAPNGPAFTNIRAPYLSPAISSSCCQCRVNFGDRPFAHKPPDCEYTSVHAFNMQPCVHTDHS